MHIKLLRDSPVLTAWDLSNVFNPKSVESSNVQGIKGHKVMPFCMGTKGAESRSLRSWGRKPGTKRQLSPGGEEEGDGGDLFHALEKWKKSSFRQGSYSLLK